ncbi:hypothetical protein [Calothrix sp. 336/3]|nr:hypothetical protein [Calothrix sp. 336/3]
MEIIIGNFDYRSIDFLIWKLSVDALRGLLVAIAGDLALLTVFLKDV